MNNLKIAFIVLACVIMGLVSFFLMNPKFSDVAITKSSGKGSYDLNLFHTVNPHSAEDTIPESSLRFSLGEIQGRPEVDFITLKGGEAIELAAQISKCYEIPIEEELRLTGEKEVIFMTLEAGGKWVKGKIEYTPSSENEPVGVWLDIRSSSYRNISYASLPEKMKSIILDAWKESVRAKG